MNQLLKTALWATAAAGIGSWLLGRARAGSDYSFANKRVLITGGSRGLGLVLARELASQQARLAICARKPEELERAAAELGSSGSPPLTWVCDLTQPAQVKSMIDGITEKLGPIDVLINNAGIIGVGPLSTMTRADFEEALAVNFWGAYNTVEAVLPTMRQQHEGRIVNISSIGGKVSIPHLLPYSTAKFALAGYSQGLRAELADEGIVVTTIYPGLMRTGSPRNATFKGKHEAEYLWFKLGDSLPLLTISAEHAARAIIEACRNGEAEAVLSLPAQLLVLLQYLVPESVATMKTLANRLLPSADGSGPEGHRGKDSETPLTQSFLMELTDAAAVRNNEMAADETINGHMGPK